MNPRTEFMPSFQWDVSYCVTPQKRDWFISTKSCNSVKNVHFLTLQKPKEPRWQSVSFGLWSVQKYNPLTELHYSEVVNESHFLGHPLCPGDYLELTLDANKSHKNILFFLTYVPCTGKCKFSHDFFSPVPGFY